MIRFSVWLVSRYAHVFVLLSVVIVTLPIHCERMLQFSSDERLQAAVYRLVRRR